MSERKSANAYRTISEVAESLGVPQHVLRFWETKFPAVKPLKRGGNRRYYRPEDIELLQVIHRLLHVDGYTIKGAQKLLKDRGVRTLVAELLGGAPAPDAAGAAAEAEAEAALAEAGIPEALTREPDTAPAPVPSEEPAPAGAAMPAVAPVAFAPPASLTDAASAPAVAAPKTDANTAALVRELKSIRARLAAALA